MRYRLSMPEPHTHLFHLEAEIDGAGAEVELLFPVWTPGSYLVREFARHVEAVAASDGDGRALPVERLDKHRFRISAAGAGRAVLRYRVYANELTVRTCHLDGTHGFVNGAAVFPIVRGREAEPHRVEVVPPPGWSVATALEGGPTAFTARDYDELADSPLEIGTHRVVRFTALGKPHEIAIWGRGEVDEARLATDAGKVVEAFAALMGGLPYDRYLFIVHLADKRRGGLEHARSSTLHVARTGFYPPEAYEETLGLLAHELFHAWNVKRLRPAALVPLDYSREQYTRLLWWFEGATSYYENVALARAGLLAPKHWLKRLGQALTALERTPGARKTSAEEASFLAWVKLYRQDENSVNSAVSYYLKGELVCLALDLELRRAGSSLDAVLRRLYAQYAMGTEKEDFQRSGGAGSDITSPSPPRSGGEGRGEGAGLPEDGVERAAAELLGPAPARRFFDRFVRGTEPLVLDPSVLGLALRRRVTEGFDDKGGTPPKPNHRPPPGFLGAELPNGPKLVVSSVREGSPAHLAGLYAEDEIVAEGGFRVDRAALWDRLCQKGPGGTLALTVFRRDELVEVPVVLGEPPEDAVWLEPLPDATPEQRGAFEAWCGGRWPDER
jgi:predicted metalloprotease with PDZ domain